ncbi:MAG: hypothetical protein WA981_15335 [Glaciecola sp.]
MSDNVSHSLREALQRIIDKKTVHIKKGSKISQANVIRETGRSLDDIKLSRYPVIQAKIKEEKSNQRKQFTMQAEKASRARRSLQDRLKDAEKQRNQLVSIVESQNIYIQELLDKIDG